MLQPPLDPKLLFLNLHKKNIDVEQKTELKIRKKNKDKERGFEREKRKETNNTEKGSMNKSFAIEYHWGGNYYILKSFRLL